MLLLFKRKLLACSTNETILQCHMQPRYPEYPHQHYAAVGAPSVQGFQDLEATSNHRASDKRPNAIGPSSGLISIKVIPGVAVLTPKPISGRRGKNGPLIHSGHTGEKYGPTDTRYSIKEQYSFLGIPAAGTSDLKKKENITIYSGAGMVEAIATHSLKFGQKFTWLPPPINTPDEVKSIQDTRNAMSRLGATNYVPTQLVPIDAELLTDCLEPMVEVFVGILKSSRDAPTALGKFGALANTKNPRERIAYQGIWVPALATSTLTGVAPLDIALATWFGQLSQKMSLAEIQAKLTNGGLVGNFTADNSKQSRNAMVSFNAAISTAKELVRPVGTALDSAEPGAPFRLILE